MNIKTSLIISILFLSGCVATDKNIRVLQSKSEITIKTLQIQDGDTLMCDPEGCRKLK